MAERENIAMLQVKGNQKELLVTIEESAKISHPFDLLEYSEKGHGRVETRKIEVFKFKHDHWSEVRSFVKITKQASRKIHGEYKDENSIRFFIVNKIPTASIADEISRKHWFVENKHHHIRDVQLKEDDRRIKIKPAIMMIIRSFGYNIIQLNLKLPQFITQIEYNKMHVNKIFRFTGVL